MKKQDFKKVMKSEGASLNAVLRNLYAVSLVDENVKKAVKDTGVKLTEKTSANGDFWKFVHNNIRKYVLIDGKKRAVKIDKYAFLDKTKVYFVAPQTSWEEIVFDVLFSDKEKDYTNKAGKFYNEKTLSLCAMSEKVEIAIQEDKEQRKKDRETAKELLALQKAGKI